MPWWQGPTDTGQLLYISYNLFLHLSRIFWNFSAGFGTLLGHLILCMLLASVTCTTLHAYKGTVSYKRTCFEEHLEFKSQCVWSFRLHTEVTQVGRISINPLKPAGYVMHQQFNIQQVYVLPTLYLCVLYLSENKQRLVPLTAQTDWFL